MLKNPLNDMFSKKKTAKYISQVEINQKIADKIKKFIMRLNSIGNNIYVLNALNNIGNLVINYEREI